MSPPLEDRLDAGGERLRRATSPAPSVVALRQRADARARVRQRAVVAAGAFAVLVLLATAAVARLGAGSPASDVATPATRPTVMGTTTSSVSTSTSEAIVVPNCLLGDPRCDPDARSVVVTVRDARRRRVAGVEVTTVDPGDPAGRSVVVGSTSQRGEITVDPLLVGPELVVRGRRPVPGEPGCSEGVAGRRSMEQVVHRPVVVVRVVPGSRRCG